MKILVVGDSCEDVFIYGECSRLAPAAPVPVFVEQYRKSNKGMAGNVYENVVSLGAHCDIVTNTTEIIKTRYVEKKTNHMIVRIDTGEQKVDRIKELHKIDMQEYDAVIVSDYDKGFLHEEDIAFIAKNHDLVFLDTKKIIGDWAADIEYIKINEVEHEKTKRTITDFDWIYNKLIVTAGEAGCFYKNLSFPVEKVEIKDLTGAGDSFLSALVYKFVKEKNILAAIEFANQCATLVVQQKGVNTINDI
jgi:bifunctional ADP-heptose synthase (sugar kinase/adenylyltransferase)